MPVSRVCRRTSVRIDGSPSNESFSDFALHADMSDTMWSAGISLFYVGYIISQLPASVLLAKGSPRIQMPCYMLAWSVVTACMAAMTSGWSFLVCRFFVGLAEGPFLPMVSVMSSSWYTKEEAPFRMAVWHAGNIASNIFSGLLAAGILTTMDGIANLRAWQWFVLLEGKISESDAFVA
jgi:MFS family permease